MATLLVLAILVAAIVLFVTEWVRVDVVAIGVVVALMLSGVLTTAEALSGFSNPAVLTIASLFVVGGAVLQTGLAGMVGPLFHAPRGMGCLDALRRGERRAFRPAFPRSTWEREGGGRLRTKPPKCARPYSAIRIPKLH